jgi:hypothetical protein
LLTTPRLLATVCLLAHCSNNAMGPCIVEAQSQSYQVTFALCSADASTEAGTCFTSCAEACAVLKPSSLPGAGVCTSVASDAGETMTASCATGFTC